jgi:hypothetical protein
MPVTARHTHGHCQGPDLTVRIGALVINLNGINFAR